MHKWKIPAVSAGIGGLVSLIAGIAGANPFGSVLMRMVVSILIAGAVGFAIRYVLRRFLPEIGARTQPESAPAVDIVIEDDLNLGGPKPASEAAEEAAPLAAEEPEPSMSELPAEALEPEADLEAGSAAESAPEGEPDDLEAIPGAEEAAFPADSLESLPDIGGLAPSSKTGTGRLRGELSGAQVDSLIQGQDPASLAKAVRTFLRKDQEG